MKNLSAMGWLVVQNGEVLPEIENSWGSDWKDNGHSVLTGWKAWPDDAVCPAVVLGA